MKCIITLAMSFAALAAALPQSLNERAPSPGPQGPCKDGVYKYGAYHFDDHCAQKFDLNKSGYKVMIDYPGLSYQDCVHGCSTGPDKCCAVNYNKATKLCQYLQRDDNTADCYASPVFYSEAPGYDSSTCVPPHKSQRVITR